MTSARTHDASRRRGSTSYGLASATLACAGLALLAVTACKSASGSATGAGRLPLPGGGGVDFEGHLSFGGSSYEAENDSPKCFEIKFYDANGQEVGGATLTPGSNHGGMPSTATSWTAVEKPCPQGGGSGGGGGTSADFDELAIGTDLALDVRRAPTGTLGGPATSLAHYDVVGGPVWFDRESTDHNALYSLRILASSPDDAAARARLTIRAPVGTAPDHDVEVVLLAQVLESGISASFLSFAKTPIVTCDVSLNSIPNYAGLGNGATQSFLPTGMWCVEAPISWTDLEGYGSTNRMHLDFEHAGSSGPRYAYYSIRHFD